MTDVTTIAAQDYDAALARLRDYKAQLEGADRQADQNSLDRARDLEVLYQAMRWVDEVPAPKNTIWRGRPVDPHSRNRFATWVLQSTGLSPSRVTRLHSAHEIAANISASGTIIRPETEGAVRPLTRLKRAGYGDRIPEVYRRAVQLAEGKPPTSAETGKAVRDYLAQFTVTERRETKSKDWLEQRRQSIIRDFKILLEMEQFATAEQVLNEQLAAWHARVPEETK
jgi:hypothetical protein